MPVFSASKSTSALIAPSASTAVTTIDTRLMESLVGCNARRDFLAIIDVFAQRMAVYDLLVIDFSLLSLIHHNPGTTVRQFVVTLKIQPPTWSARSAGLKNAA